MIADFQVGLFDLDGVVLDTESQYSVFWGSIGREFFPAVPDFSWRIKGQTLTQILDGWFAGQQATQEEVVRRLNSYEQQMCFPYIAGAEAYLKYLRTCNIRTAVVTSSNHPKMAQVERQHPELSELFDVILTSEDFTASKPAPDCYLLGARHFGVEPGECVVFEDSLNGLRAARAAGCYVVGLATTLPPEEVAPLADSVIPDFTTLLPA